MSIIKWQKPPNLANLSLKIPKQLLTCAPVQLKSIFLLGQKYWQFLYSYDGKFCHLQELKIYQILLKTPLFRTLCRCIDLVSMRIASLTLWQTRFSRKSHHVRFFYIFFKTLFIYNFISSHFFRKCKPAFQKLFYLTIVKNRESLIITMASILN